MSGIYSRLPYDQCAGVQKTRDSCEPGNYITSLDLYINPTFKNVQDVPCANNEKDIGCKKCDLNTGSVMGLGPENFGQKADIEDNLRGIKRNLTKCASEQFVGCDFKVQNRVKDECNNFVVVTPGLCERNIVPTNMKLPDYKGF